MRGVDSKADADVRKRRDKGSASNDANETPVRSRAKSPGTMSVPSANAPEGLGKRCMGAIEGARGRLRAQLPFMTTATASSVRMQKAFVCKIFMQK
jgi:hypothetical protein